MTNDIVFTTVHGSRLYGLSRVDSDRDSMIVYSNKRRTTQKKVGDEDVIHVSIYTLLDLAGGGAHQFVEAVFSDQKEWFDESWKPMLDSFTVPIAAAREKYMRTIWSFIRGDTTKSRRHAVRLSLELHDLGVYGRCTPRLSDERKMIVRNFADDYRGKDLYNQIKENIL